MNLVVARHEAGPWMRDHIQGVSIASGVGYGVKSFTREELESAVRNGLALDPQPVRPMGHSISRPSQPQLQMFFGVLSN